MSQPRAFLSYTRIDDEFFGGAITALKNALELGVKVVTGNRDFKIFQDVDGIGIGEQWKNRIDGALSESRFLIPIITPLFFTSEACRDELKKFIEVEKKTGRDDLILPIYFVTCPALEKLDQRSKDTLALEIHKRQRRDWRSQADLPITDVKVRQEVKLLSEQIARALDRTNKSITPQITLALDKVREQQFQENAETVDRTTIRTGDKTSRNNRNYKSILWVDDRPNNNIYERGAMEKYNIKFILSTSTEDALDKLSSAAFDAIISDMSRPPDLNAGYTLLGSVRSRGIRVPYFIYAGSRAPEHIEEARRRGAQGTTNIASELIQLVVSSLPE